MNGLPPALRRAARRQQSALERQAVGQQSQRRAESEARDLEAHRQNAAAAERENARNMERTRTMDLLLDRKVRGAARQEAYRRALKDPKMRTQAISMQRLEDDEKNIAIGRVIAEAAASKIASDPKLSLLEATRQAGAEATRRFAGAAYATDVFRWTGDPQVDKARFRRRGFTTEATTLLRALRRGGPASLAGARQQLAQDWAQWIKDAAELEKKLHPALSNTAALHRAALRLLKRRPEDRLHGASA